MNNLILILLFSVVNLFPNETMTDTTTFIIVRHAEKDGTGNDPGLSADGKARAEELRRTLAEVPVHAIYSTPYQRTRQTVTPLAAEKGIAITEYAAAKPAGQFAEELFSAYRGKTVLICGHSNTVPEIVRTLGKTDQPITIDEPHFDNIFIVTCTENAAPGVLRLKFGKSSR